MGKLQNSFCNIANFIGIHKLSPREIYGLGISFYEAENVVESGDFLPELCNRRYFISFIEKRGIIKLLLKNMEYLGYGTYDTYCVRIIEHGI